MLINTNKTTVTMPNARKIKIFVSSKSQKNNIAGKSSAENFVVYRRIISLMIKFFEENFCGAKPLSQVSQNEFSKNKKNGGIKTAIIKNSIGFSS